MINSQSSEILKIRAIFIIFSLIFREIIIFIQYVFSLQVIFISLLSRQSNSCMRRIIPLIARQVPLLFKIATTATFLYAYHQLQVPSLNCSTLSRSASIAEIQSKIVRIENNGDLVGYAFCFQDHYLVSASFQLVEEKNRKKNYEFYLGDTKIEDEFRFIGNFENLTFIQFKGNSRLKKLPCLSKSDHFSVQEVQIIQKRQYLSIKNGYRVAKDSGYEIVDGKGEVGSLVIQNGKAVGIVQQVGRDAQSGFLRLVDWNDLEIILQRVKNGKLHLGISASAIEGQQGIAVSLVSAYSPLKNSIRMGDIILKANNQKIRTPQAFYRLCFISNGVRVEILRENKSKLVDITI